ncbi:MAG: carbonic anhydrase [Fluviibacter sp.]
MCQTCEQDLNQKPTRRDFLKYATLGLGATLSSVALPTTAFAAPPATPKPENVLTPDAALTRLMECNRRYVKGVESTDSFTTVNKALATGQNPYACILGCADSRVSPELAFDENQGDLFITRVAGNFVTPEILASLEYGTAVLNAQLIMVLGHTSCGAIGAAIKAVEKDESFPGHIQSLTTALSPAVEGARKRKPKDLADAATRENIRLNVLRLRSATPILSKRVRDGQLKVVGGLYDIKTGRVELIEVA